MSIDMTIIDREKKHCDSCDKLAMCFSVEFSVTDFTSLLKSMPSTVSVLDISASADVCDRCRRQLEKLIFQPVSRMLIERISWESFAAGKSDVADKAHEKAAEELLEKGRKMIDRVCLWGKPTMTWMEMVSMIRDKLGVPNDEAEDFVAQEMERRRMKGVNATRNGTTEANGERNGRLL